VSVKLSGRLLGFGRAFRLLGGEGWGVQVTWGFRKQGGTKGGEREPRRGDVGLENRKGGAGNRRGASEPECGGTEASLGQWERSRRGRRKAVAARVVQRRGRQGGARVCSRVTWRPNQTRGVGTNVREVSWEVEVKGTRPEEGDEGPGDARGRGGHASPVCDVSVENEVRGAVNEGRRGRWARVTSS
jgi:hypothetical protein